MNPFPWQQTQWQQLLSQHHQDRLPQVLLLHGAEGLGKRQFAENFAQYLFCKAADMDSACGKCRDCQLFSAQTHPDFFIISPEKNSKTIKVEQIRELLAALQSTSQRGGYQIVLLQPAEALNISSVNMLLKTLEEPAGKVLFLMLSSRPGTLPATIISRCQKIAFYAEENSQTLAWLKTKIADAESCGLLLRAADYAPLKAIELAEKNYLLHYRQLTDHLLHVLQKSKPPLSIDWDYKNEDFEIILNAWIAIVTSMVYQQLKSLMPAALQNKY